MAESAWLEFCALPVTLQSPRKWHLTQFSASVPAQDCVKGAECLVVQAHNLLALVVELLWEGLFLTQIITMVWLTSWPPRELARKETHVQWTPAQGWEWGAGERLQVQLLGTILLPAHCVTSLSLHVLPSQGFFLTCNHARRKVVTQIPIILTESDRAISQQAAEGKTPHNKWRSLEGDVNLGLGMRNSH